MSFRGGLGSAGGVKEKKRNKRGNFSFSRHGRASRRMSTAAEAFNIAQHTNKQFKTKKTKKKEANEITLTLDNNLLLTSSRVTTTPQIQFQSNNNLFFFQFRR